MQKFQKSQAKKILTAAGDARLALANPPPPTRAEVEQQQRIKRAQDKALAAALTKAGLDLAPLRALKPPLHQDPLQRWKAHKAKVAKQSALAARMMRRSIDSRRAALARISTPPIPPILGLRPYYVVLDTPFLITRTLGLVMDDSHIEPWNSWAKVRAYAPSTQGSGSIELRFYHVWQNTSGVQVSVDAHSYLVLNGGAAAFVDGTVFPDSSRHSDVDIDVHLYPWEWWNAPPTLPLAQPDQSQNVMSLHQGGSSWFSEFTLEEQEQDVFRGYDLSYSAWSVPVNAFTVFETSMSINFSNQGGGLLVDFSGESQNSVMSAAVLLHVSPSIGVVVSQQASD